MPKPNDFFAANLNAPENFTFEDFYTHDITPDNTELRDPEYYKSIPQVQKEFTKNGKFDDDAFKSYYNGVLRLYNDFSQLDYTQQVIDSIERAPESIRDLNNTRIKDTSAILYSNPDPWRHSRGMQGIKTIGDPSFDIREVAQANYMRDENGNKLDYKPNDLKFFKGLFAKPAVLAEDEYGNPLLDENGDPYYRELKKGEDLTGKTLLHWTDTFTEDDSPLNKFDFFDRDGLEKSVGGTIMDTAFRIAPYFIPYVGQVIGGLQAVSGLVAALPMLVKSVDGILENDPNSAITKKMNQLDAFMSRYDRSKSRKSMEKNWTFENIGDMIADSIMQLRQQKTFTYLPQIMGAFDKAKKLEKPSEAAVKWGRRASLAFMSLTSAEDSFNTFREAGVDSRTSGIMALAYAAGLYGLMNTNYFKNWLFKDSWLTTDPELAEVLKKANREASRTVLGALRIGAENGKRVSLNTEIPQEAAGLFKRVFNATKNAWKGKTIQPFKELEITAPGAFSTANLYLNRAINEGVEETMEEAVLDLGKGVVSALDALGVNVSEDEKNKINFGLTFDDVVSRYTTAFLGGAIGGAVFEGMNKYDKWIFNDNVNAIVGKSTNAQLINAIRENGADRVKSTLESLYRRKNGLGNESLSWKGKFVVDPKNQNKQIWKYEAGNPTENQNTLMYNIMKSRIEIFDGIMKDKNFNQNDNILLARIVGNMAEKAEKSGMSIDDYMKAVGEDPITEYMKKTGAGDIILFDVNNLQTDIVELQTKINAAKAEISKQYAGDTSDVKQQRDDAIKNDAYIKSLEDQMKQKEKEYDALINGNSAAYYIRLANFTSSDQLLARMLGNEDSEGHRTLPWTKESFARLRYQVNYNNLPEVEQQQIDEEYKDFLKLSKEANLDVIVKANDVYQATRELILNSLKGINIQDIISDSAFLPALVQSKVGETEQDAQVNRALSPKIEQDAYTIITDIINSGHTDRAIQELQNYIEGMISNKIIALNFEDFKNYAYDKIINSLREEVDNINIKSTLNKLYSDLTEGRLVSEDYTNAQTIQTAANEKWAQVVDDYFDAHPDQEDKRDSYLNGEDIPGLEEAIQNWYNEQNRLNGLPEEDLLSQTIAASSYTNQNKLNSDTNEQNNFISEFKTRLSEVLDLLKTNPDNAIIKLTELQDFIKTNIPAEVIYNEVVAPIATILNNLQNLQNIVSRASEIKQSPVLYLLNALAAQNGEQLKLLDLLDKEQRDLHQLKNVDDYVLNSYAAYEIDMIQNLLPLVETILYSAAAGIDENTDRMLADAGLEEKLPEISQEFVLHAFNELAFVENKIKFLSDLHNNNMNAKTKEQTLVRKNFFRNVYKKLIEPEGISGDYISKINSLLNGKTIKELWEEACSEVSPTENIDFESDDDQAQIDVMKAFIKFETKLYNQVKAKNQALLGKEIADIFPDNWKTKNGVLSRNADDELSNFDLTSYLLAVLGSDPSAFYSKLKEKFGEEKFPFFGQELAIRLAYTGITNPDLLNGALNGLKSQLDEVLNNPDANGLVNLNADGTTSKLPSEDLEYLRSKPIISNTVFIDGFAGVGKSTMVLKTALEIAGKDKYEIFVSAKDAKRAKQLGKSVEFEENSENIKTVDELLADILGEEYDPKKYEKLNNGHTFALTKKNGNYKFHSLFKTTKPRIIAIDEGTQLTEAQWEILSIAARNSNAVIIGLGNTMQFGASNDSGDSGNIDDCLIMLGTKLTVSMRDGNAGKSRNNLIVGTKVSEVIQLTKEYPATDNANISKRITGKIVLDYGRDSEGRICGDEIVPEVNMELINKTIETLHDDESIVIITENESLKSQILDKYKDDSRVSIRSKADCAGDEFDYAIIDENIDTNPSTKVVELKNFYTYITRARKGSIIKTSSGLTSNLEVSCKLSPTASANIASVVGTDAANRYKSLRSSSLEDVTAAIETSTTTTPEVTPTSPVISGEVESILKPKPQKTAEEIKNEILDENSAEGNVQPKEFNTEDDFEDSLTLGNPKRGNSAIAWEKRKAIMNNPTGIYIDYNDLAEQLDALKTLDDSSVSLVNHIAKWLGIESNTKLTSGLKDDGNNATDNELLDKYKRVVNIIASAILNTEFKSSDDLENWKEQIQAKISDRITGTDLGNILDIDFSPDFLDAIQNGTYRFIVKDSESDKKNIYFSFPSADKKYIIPLGKIKNATPGVFKQLIIDKNQTADIVMMSSNGTHRGTATPTNRADMLHLQGRLLTMILGNTDNITTTNDGIKRFIKQVGKSFIPLCREFGLTDGEILSLLKPESENGDVSYLYQRTIPINIAGVQKNISPKDFFAVINALRRRIKDGIQLNPTGQEKSDAEIIQRVFGVSESELYTDFGKVSSDVFEEDTDNTYERLTTISRKYGILSERGRDLVFSALILNGLNSRISDQTEAIKGALLKYFTNSYTAKTDGDKKRFGSIKLIWNKLGERAKEMYIFQGPNDNIHIAFGYERSVLSNSDFIDTEIKSSDFLTEIQGVTVETNLFTALSKVLNFVKDPQNFAAEFFNSIGIKPNEVTAQNLADLFNDSERDLRISIARAVQLSDTNEGNSILFRFYPPFESELYRFLTPEGSTEPIFSDEDIAKIVGEDPKYVYGIYTNIIGSKIEGADSDVWMRGNVSESDCSWDIVDIYGAVYGLGANPFTETDSSDSDLSEFSNTKVTSNVDETTVNQSKQEVTFDKNGIATNINCDDKLKKLVVNSLDSDEDSKSAILSGDVSIKRIYGNKDGLFISLVVNGSEYDLKLKNNHIDLFEKLKITKNIIPGEIIGDFVFNGNSVEKITNKTNQTTAKCRITGLSTDGVTYKVSYIYDNGTARIDEVTLSDYEKLAKRFEGLRGVLLLNLDGDFKIYRKFDGRINTIVIEDSETGSRTEVNPTEVNASLTDDGVVINVNGQQYTLTTVTDDILKLFNFEDFIIPENCIISPNGSFEKDKPTISGRLLNRFFENEFDPNQKYSISAINKNTQTVTVNGKSYHMPGFFDDFGSRINSIPVRTMDITKARILVDDAKKLADRINTVWDQNHNIEEVQEILDDAFLTGDVENVLRAANDNGVLVIKTDNSPEAQIKKAFANNENVALTSLSDLEIISGENGKFLVNLNNGSQKLTYNVEVRDNNVLITEQSSEIASNQDSIIDRINNSNLNNISKKYLLALNNNDFDAIGNVFLEGFSKSDSENPELIAFAQEIQNKQIKCTK